MSPTDPAAKPTFRRRPVVRRMLLRGVRLQRRLALRLSRLLGRGGREAAVDPAEAVRRLDRAVAAGDLKAARIRAEAPTGYPGSPDARGRAAALSLLAERLPPADRDVERAVVTFLRTSRPARETAGRGPVGTATEALLTAARLRGAGHARPRLVVTLPALEGNPYTTMMEQAYEANGLAAVHVDDLEDAAAAIDARLGGAFDAVLHVNASNRLVWRARDEAAAAAASATTLERIDAWRASGVPLVVTVHDGPILGPVHADAERSLAQGIADRAAVIHVLTRTTPAVLGDWLRLDPARIVHFPHPRFDGVYAPLPPRAKARAALGLDPRDPAVDGPEIVLGMLGILSARKGPLQLLEALAEVPPALPDGRRLRLILGGRVVDPGGESVIRAAFADDRVMPELGQIRRRADPGAPRGHGRRRRAVPALPQLGLDRARAVVVDPRHRTGERHRHGGRPTRGARHVRPRGAGLAHRGARRGRVAPDARGPSGGASLRRGPRRRRDLEPLCRDPPGAADRGLTAAAAAAGPGGLESVRGGLRRARPPGAPAAGARPGSRLDRRPAGLIRPEHR